MTEQAYIEAKYNLQEGYADCLPQGCANLGEHSLQLLAGMQIRDIRDSDVNTRRNTRRQP
jgi:hypothetical protein